MEHPVEVLGYAIRHGYDDMRDKAAPLTLDVTFELARKSLSPEGLLAWVGVLTGLAIFRLTPTHAVSNPRSHIVRNGLS